MTPSIRDALGAGHLGHLTTLNVDGSPQVSAVWVGLEDDDIVIGHLMGGAKIRNIARDPRVALSIEATGANDIGMAHHLTIYGQARMVKGGAAQLLQRLAAIYLGPGVIFPPMDSPPAGHVIHITPERFTGIGPWNA